MGHHAELVEALKARNPRWARAVMAAHIESTRSVASVDKEPKGADVTADDLRALAEISTLN